MDGTKKSKQILGWREWVALPDWGIDAIKAKIDTGARTSAVHAENIRIFKRRDERIVKFVVHPIQNDRSLAIEAQAKLVEKRIVRSSSGLISKRPVVVTTLVVGTQHFPIEVTLVNRDVMGFRMLLGRQALRGKFLVNPSGSYRSRPRKRRLKVKP